MIELIFLTSMFMVLIFVVVVIYVFPESKPKKTVLRPKNPNPNTPNPNTPNPNTPNPNTPNPNTPNPNTPNPNTPNPVPGMYCTNHNGGTLCINRQKFQDHWNFRRAVMWEGTNDVCKNNPAYRNLKSVAWNDRVADHLNCVAHKCGRVPPPHSPGNCLGPVCHVIGEGGGFTFGGAPTDFGDITERAKGALDGQLTSGGHCGIILDPVAEHIAVGTGNCGDGINNFFVYGWGTGNAANPQPAQGFQWCLT